MSGGPAASDYYSELGADASSTGVGARSGYFRRAILNSFQTGQPMSAKVAL
jgi:hypothetical protein